MLKLKVYKVQFILTTRKFRIESFKKRLKLKITTKF
jgi:hypothetical protein